MSTKEKQFKSTLLSGLRWSAVKRFGQAFLSIAVLVIMARLLEPSDFGLVAMATVFTGISNVFTELGTGEALIRKKDPSKEFISSIFWLNTSLSLVVCIALFFISPFAASLYDEKIVELLIYILSIEILLSGVNRVSHALMEKEMRFKAIAYAQLISQIMSSFIGISMAYLGYGLWSLVALGISSQLLYTIILNLFLKWMPSLTFKVEHIKDIFTFSSYLTSMKILDHAQRRSEIFIVAYFMGSYLGGVYSQTVNLMRKPIKLIGGFMIPVLFSSMSSVLDKPEHVKSLYLKSIQSFFMIYAPIGIILILYSDPFVLFVLGDQWFEMIPLVPVFGLMLLYWSLHKCNVTSLKSIGRVDILFKIYIVYVPLSIIGCLIGVQYGIFWVAISMLITTCLLFLTSTLLTLKVIKIKKRIYVKQIEVLLYHSFIMLFVGYTANMILNSYFYETPHIFRATISMILSIGIYVFFIIKYPVEALIYIKELIKIKRG